MLCFFLHFCIEFPGFTLIPLVGSRAFALIGYTFAATSGKTITWGDFQGLQLSTKANNLLKIFPRHTVGTWFASCGDLYPLLWQISRVSASRDLLPQKVINKLFKLNLSCFMPKKTKQNASTWLHRWPDRLSSTFSLLHSLLPVSALKAKWRFPSCAALKLEVTTLIDLPSLWTETPFLVFCAMSRSHLLLLCHHLPRVGSHASRRTSRTRNCTNLFACLFIYFLSHAAWIRRFQVQVLEILQHLVSPATPLAGFLEAAWGGEDKSLTYHFNYIAWRLHGCKAIVKEGRWWRPLSVCEEQTGRWPSPCRAAHFQRFSLSLLLSSTACMPNSAHGREHRVLCKRVFLFFLHQLTGRCQRPRLLNRVQKDKFI